MKNPIKFTKIDSGECVICDIKYTARQMWKGINTGQVYCNECKNALEEEYFANE